MEIYCAEALVAHYPADARAGRPLCGRCHLTAGLMPKVYVSPSGFIMTRSIAPFVYAFRENPTYTDTEVRNTVLWCFGICRPCVRMLPYGI